MRANNQGTIAIAANATVQNVALPLGGGELIMLSNAGPQIAYLELTSDANLPVLVPTSTSGGGVPLLANAPAIELRTKAGDTRISVVSAGNSAVYVTRGQGI